MYVEVLSQLLSFKIEQNAWRISCWAPDSKMLKEHERELVGEM